MLQKDRPYTETESMEIIIRKIIQLENKVKKLENERHVEKEKNKKYRGYQSNKPIDMKLDDSNPPRGGSGVLKLFNCVCKVFQPIGRPIDKSAIKSRYAIEPLTRKLPPTPKRPPKT